MIRQFFHDDLAGQMRAKLAEVAASIGARAPSTRFRFEFPASSVYDFVGLLIFAHEDNPTIEDAVLSVELTRRPTARWTIDLVGRDSLALSKLTDLSPDIELRMAADAAVAVDVILDFLHQNADAIVNELGDRKHQRYAASRRGRGRH